MAIWQYVTKFVPRTKFVEKFGIEFDKVDFEQFEDAIRWEFDSVSFHELSKNSILNHSKGWHENLDFFGEVDKTCISISRENNLIYDATLKIDLRDIKGELLEDIINFLKNNDYLLISCSGNVYEPTMKNIIGELKISKAFEFTKNPENFLEKLHIDTED